MPVEPLSKFEPHWLELTDAKTWRRVETKEEADGVELLCPKCFAENKGPVGTHTVICWSPIVPADQLPGPGRWSLEGTGFDDLTLVAGSSSILLDGCGAHFRIHDGKVIS